MCHIQEFIIIILVTLEIRFHSNVVNDDMSMKFGRVEYSLCFFTHFERKNAEQILSFNPHGGYSTDKFFLTHVYWYFFKLKKLWMSQNVAIHKKNMQVGGREWKKILPAVNFPPDRFNFSLNKITNYIQERSNESERGEKFSLTYFKSKIKGPSQQGVWQIFDGHTETLPQDEGGA